MDRLKAFLYTFDNYMKMVSVRNSAEPRDWMEPISSEQEIRIKLILLRKYCSPEHGESKLPAIVLIERFMELFPDKKTDGESLIEEINQIENKMDAVTLGDGSNLSLRKTIELELYGIYLHSDYKKIMQLQVSDTTLRLIAMRRYVDIYESVLIRFYRLLKSCGIEEIQEKAVEKAEVIRPIPNDQSEQNVKLSPYWSNIYGRDASDSELIEDLIGKSEEDKFVILSAIAFINEVEKDEPNVEALQQFVHPSTVNEWGDFREVSAMMRGYNNIGFSSKVRYNERHDMAYVTLFDNVDNGFFIEDHQIINDSKYVTLVIDENSDEWRVYAIGDRLDEYVITLSEIIKKLKKKILPGESEDTNVQTKH